eukprot:jgi/Psemu1/222211/e_gw1.1196.6.1
MGYRHRYAYLEAVTCEKVCIKASPEFGLLESKGKYLLIFRALYGLPVAGASFRSYLTKHLRDLGYSPCKAGPDVHLRI